MFVCAVVCKALGEAGAIVRPEAALVQSSKFLASATVGKLPRQYLGAAIPIQINT